MKIKKTFFFMNRSLGVGLFFVFARFAFCTAVVPVQEAATVLPLFPYMYAKTLEGVAKKFVEREDVRIQFEKLDESLFKIEVRRQFYLSSKGTVLDDQLINFSVLELLEAGMLDERIEAAREAGKLDLSNSKIGSLYGLTKVKEKVPFIKELDLSNNSLVVIANSDFAWFTSLKRLTLSYNQIVFLQEGCFDRLVNLIFLDLGHNEIVYLPPNIFANQRNLRGLDLSDNEIEFVHGMTLFGLKKLENLNLSDNPIEDKSAVTNVVNKLKEINPNVEVVF